MVDKPTPEEIEKAKNRWANGFFSWSDNFTVTEVDSAFEGFLAGVNWILKRLDDSSR